MFANLFRIFSRSNFALNKFTHNTYTYIVEYQMFDTRESRMQYTLYFYWLQKFQLRRNNESII